LDNLIQYRLDNAKEKLESAEILLNAGKYKDSIGRSYYAIFSAVRAILALDRVDFSKHAGVIAYFQKEYVKTKNFYDPTNDAISPKRGMKDVWEYQTQIKKPCLKRNNMETVSQNVCPKYECKL